MKLTLVTKFEGPNYTIGDLLINGVVFCNTLEDTIRKLIDLNHDGDFDDKNEGKVFGETAIPRGTYKIILSYSNRFKRILPELLNVVGFAGIRIHSGNTAVDTHGCILVGDNSEKGKVLGSKIKEVALIKMMQAALKNHEKITIEIK